MRTKYDKKQQGIVFKALELLKLKNGILEQRSVDFEELLDKHDSAQQEMLKLFPEYRNTSGKRSLIINELKNARRAEFLAMTGYEVQIKNKLRKIALPEDRVISVEPDANEAIVSEDGRIEGLLNIYQDILNSTLALKGQLAVLQNSIKGSPAARPQITGLNEVNVYLDRSINRIRKIIEFLNTVEL